MKEKPPNDTSSFSSSHQTKLVSTVQPAVHVVDVQMINKVLTRPSESTFKPKHTSKHGGGTIMGCGCMSGLCLAGSHMVSAARALICPGPTTCLEENRLSLLNISGIFSSSTDRLPAFALVSVHVPAEEQLPPVLYLESLNSQNPVVSNAAARSVITCTW